MAQDPMPYPHPRTPAVRWYVLTGAGLLWPAWLRTPTDPHLPAVMMHPARTALLTIAVPSDPTDTYGVAMSYINRSVTVPFEAVGFEINRDAGAVPFHMLIQEFKAVADAAGIPDQHRHVFAVYQGNLGWANQLPADRIHAIAGMPTDEMRYTYERAGSDDRPERKRLRINTPTGDDMWPSQSALAIAVHASWYHLNAARMPIRVPVLGSEPVKKEKGK